uniref:Uncharacterized protein n=1 Tax=Anguilla anguilla TaxID=7936 RepID=A0A0E9WAV5_ANGAN
MSVLQSLSFVNEDGGFGHLILSLTNTSSGFVNKIKRFRQM